MLRFSDARNFGRTLTGLCLIAGPIIFMIAQLVSPDVGNDNKVKELAKVAQHKHWYLFGGILFLVASVLVLAASVGLIRFFANRRVTLGQIAGGLLLVGSAATVAFYAFTTVEYEMVNISGLDRAQMARLLDKAMNANSGIPLFIMFGVGITIGLILLAIASWRSKVVPRWVAPVLVAAGVAAFVGGNSKAAGIVTFALLIVGFGSLGMAVLGLSDEEWAARGSGAASPAPPEPPPPAPAPTA